MKLAIWLILIILLAVFLFILRFDVTRVENHTQEALLLEINTSTAEIAQTNNGQATSSPEENKPSYQKPPASQLPPGKFFKADFNQTGFLEEAGIVEESLDPNWALTSGAYLYFSNGLAKTVQGKLNTDDKWRLYYSSYNPLDTNDGYQPQNIFRLVQRDLWQNFEQQVYFRILKDNLSQSSLRNQSNGLLLFNRYQDSDNLYYVGIRVDGAVTIKKKLEGEYYTLAYKKIFENQVGEYDRDANPTLLPHNTWLGLKSELSNNPQGAVMIKVFVDRNNDGNWSLVLEATDDGQDYDEPILKQGHGGIRTDFMDVEFDNYFIQEIDLKFN